MWRGTLGIRARKVLDSVGVETEIPMKDLVQVGVFAATKGGLSAQLYLHTHRIRSGKQMITTTVPRAPARSGIDPSHLLIDREMGNNIKDVAQDRALWPPVVLSESRLW